MTVESHSQYSKESKSESKYTSITELLPRFYEIYGDNTKFEIIRSLEIDGHHIAWMEYVGRVECGSEDSRQEMQEYRGRGLYCPCHFTQGVGWDVDKVTGKPYRLTGDWEACLQKQAAIYLRRLELQREYLGKYKIGNFAGRDTFILDKHIPEIVLDLIEKDKAGEFIGEGSNGAHFWGGHLYVQTVSEIVGLSMKDIWIIIDEMVANKQIQLEGAVIQEYYEPPVPRWDEYSRVNYEGYTGVAFIPSHSKMPQNWHIAIYAPNGQLIREDIEGPRLHYSPDFGVDSSDVANVEASIKELIDGYLWDPLSQS